MQLTKSMFFKCLPYILNKFGRFTVLQGTALTLGFMSALRYSGR